MSNADATTNAIARRDMLKAAGVAGVGLAVAGAGALSAPGRVLAQAGGAGPSGAAPSPSAPASGAPFPADVIKRPIPRTGELVPATGLGTYLTFDTLPGAPREHLKEVMRVFWEGGGRVLDTSPLYGTGEMTVGHFATALGIADKLFVANKIWSTGDYLADDSHAEKSFEQSRWRLWRSGFDLMQVHSLTNVAIILPVLKAWQKEGRIRYTGVTHHEPPYFDLLASTVESMKPDVVQVRYSIANRKAEDKVLKAAANAGTAVLVNMPLDKARLMQLVEGRPLPDFARDIGASTWSQFFLKWVISHPAVTCAIPATSNPAHAAENMGALRGPLPDLAMRERMVQHMATIPGFAELEKTPFYPGKAYPGVIGQAQKALKERA
ncbi:MAG: aldo/keto reductase [Hyphomicrobiaceae bacterium]|nr:aldo/keto reductase [Hyphomicrobiaceae bacterium]